MVLFAIIAATATAGEAPGGGSLRPVAAQSQTGGDGNSNANAPVIELDGSISISPDGSEMSYRWRQVSGPPVELSDNVSPKPRFRTNIPGIYEFELIVTANDLDSEPHLVRLEIERENLPPVAKLPGEVLGQVGKLMELDATESIDPEGESLTYQWRPMTPGLNIPPDALTKPVLAFEPTAHGVFEVELVVSDGEKASEPVRTRLQIKPKPKPPVARAQILTINIPAEPAPPSAPAAEVTTVTLPTTADKSLVPSIQPLPEMKSPSAPSPSGSPGDVPPQLAGWENSTAQPLAELSVGSFRQPESAPAAAVAAAASPIAMAPIADLSPVSDLVPMSAPNMSYLPAASPAGVPAMPGTATETPVEPVSESLSAAQQRPATMPGSGGAGIPDGVMLPGGYPALSPSPSAPQPTARITAPAVAEAGKMFMLDARDSFSPSGARLEYLWRQTSGPPVSDVEVVFDGAAERFMPTIPGDYEFELLVADRGIVSAPVSHRVRILRQPDPPVAVVVAPTHALPGSLVKMDATRSYDANGGRLTYRWRQTGGPAVRDYVIDERIGDAAPAFRPDEPGLYSFSLVVFNGATASNQVDLDIEVTEAVRRPPGLTIGGPERARVGERLVYSAVATDATGWNLTYAWQQLEGPAQALSPSGGIRAMALPPAAGRYVFRVSAQDEDGREVAAAERVLEVGGGRAGQSDDITGAPLVSPPAPVNGGAGALPRRVPELTPLSGTPSAPTSFPQPRTRGERSGSRSAEVLQGGRGQR